jgi:catechol 2,3-dioxygenase-like lactoylglutathione lyase family enzyme
MPALTSIGLITVIVRDQAKAAEFYTRLLGMAVRDRAPDIGLLTVALRDRTTALALAEPDPALGSGYEAAKAGIGGSTGIALEAPDLRATLRLLRQRGGTITAAQLEPTGYGGVHATVEDQDGNSLMLFQPAARASGKAGLARVSFANVVVRDLPAAQRFYGDVLGLARGDALPGVGWTEFRLPKGASLGVFQPRQDAYDDPQDYLDDVAHIGEPTGIAFTTDDLPALHAALAERGVRFPRAPERAAWGGMEAEFEDPDGNRFAVVQRPRRGRAARGRAAPKAGKARSAAKAARARARKDRTRGGRGRRR